MVPTLSRAARELIEELKRATDLYLELGDHGRAGTIRALHAVQTFIQEVASRHSARDQLDFVRLTEPFATLATALKELDHGAINPVIRPTVVHNRRVLPLAVRMARANAATAVELHVMAGATRDDAAKHIATLLAGSPLLEGLRQAPWKVVRSWLASIKAEEYRVPLDQVRDHHGARLDVAAFDHYIEQARELLANGEPPAGLKGFGDNLAVHGGWSLGAKKGRASLT